MKITRVHAREILDSRGNPTVEADVQAGGALGRAAVPSGASTGQREALELRDGDAKRYGGKGVRKAVANVNGEIATMLVGRELDQRAIDDRAPRTGRHADQEPARRKCAAQRVDGSRPGSGGCRGAASLPLSRADCPGQHVADSYVLPAPMMNILNGGAHADSSVDFQEFMVMPLGAAELSRRRFAPARRSFMRSARILKKAGHSTGVGDEGGFAPNLRVQSRGARRRPRSDRQDRASAPVGRVSRPRRRVERAVGQRQVRLQEVRRGQRARPNRWWSSTPTGFGSTRSSRSRTAWLRETGTAGRR